MTTPNNGEPTCAELQRRIAELEAQHELDQNLIGALMATELSEREQVANLEIALISARRIGAAVGILMERDRITDHRALDL